MYRRKKMYRKIAFLAYLFSIVGEPFVALVIFESAKQHNG